MAVRTTIQLEEDLLARLRQIVPSRGLNRFINDTLAEKVATIERQSIEEAMKEGYLAVDQERRQVDADWQAVDLEGWPA